MQTLPPWNRVLVVVAHPDDESFGLGGIIAGFTTAGAEVSVLCLTRGEASTLGTGDLAERRPREAAEAAEVLGIDSLAVRDHPDGGLGDMASSSLVREVEHAIVEHRPNGLLVFGPGGVTGHADHIAASRAAMTAAEAHRLPVLGWVLPQTVAARLEAEFGAGFVGTEHADLRVRVDRDRQREAVSRHRSQVNPVVHRRLDELGSEEWLVWMNTSTHGRREASIP